MDEKETLNMIIKLSKMALIGLSKIMNRIGYIAILIPLEIGVFGHYFILFYFEGDKDFMIHRKQIKNKFFSMLRRIASEI